MYGFGSGTDTDTNNSKNSSDRREKNKKSVSLEYNRTIMPGRESRAGKKLGQRSNPLGDDIQAQRFAASKREPTEDELLEADPESSTAGFLLNTKTTKKIFQRARQQIAEIEQDQAELLPHQIDNEEEEDAGLKHDGGAGPSSSDPGLADLLRSQYSAPPAFYDDEGDPSLNVGDGIDLMDGEEAVVLDYDDNESVVSEMPNEEAGMMMMAAQNATPGGANSMEAFYGIDEEEARLLQRFQPASRVQSRHLAGIIMEKIKEKSAEEEAAAAQESGRVGSSSKHLGGEDEEEGGHSIDPRVARVYTAIGTVLKRYTSGKIPKAFKVLPNIQNWEDLVLLTKPDQWSPHAVYQATRIFSSNLNESMAQRFYAAVLLPIVHDRLLEEKKLHPALYMAVRKALFKPVAFFKGFLLPLATDEECTLREALVIASILQRSHLPPVPTAVALVKIAQQPFRGPCSVFLRVLIDKQMALPYQAIDALVAYFHRFVRTHSREDVLPVLWHQTLLSFVQRYKNDFTMPQVQLLTQVCSMHFHYLISPEIKRELGAAQKVLQQKGVA